MKYENFNRTAGARRVLVAPLDWGLGHATRCIPIIHYLQNSGFEVVIAAEGNIAALLQQEFPGISLIRLEGYHMRYSRNRRWLGLTLMFQLPKLIRAVYREKKWLKKILQSGYFDSVISDNRLGLSHPDIPCYYITHQLQIMTGSRFTDKIARLIHYYFINQYKACWVPDSAATPNLAGALSHPRHLPKIPVAYLGPLSRFSPGTEKEKKWDCCCVLSGPEPQRTIFENIVLKQLTGYPGKVLLIRGCPNNSTPLHSSGTNLQILNHLPAEELSQAISASSLVICRSGYSSIMDLVALQQKAILVPTPGQTEQEYLARTLMEKNIFPTLPQMDFSLEAALRLATTFGFRIPVFKEDLFKEVVEGFIS